MVYNGVKENMNSLAEGLGLDDDIDENALLNENQDLSKIFINSQ